ncbi:hypothetical protein JG688_00003548 [Phytophthora aleatoria]|uniref:Uncharacterized protein n=1 Tax=Phytophthora aleatoria TaxID=2496075 RepID=A0A8J5J1T0_9STRA|nr:hypothetical protein JG688_00003548 [Phytophthora aleatoria]
MLGLWRLARGGLGSAANQYNEQLLFMPLRTATMAVVACGWEFIVEMTRSNESVRALLLILPQILLLLVVVSQFFPALQPRNRKQVIISVQVLIPMVIVAVIHSSFRLGISLCCCSRSLCPSTFPTGQAPDTSACGLVVNNCYMAFISKIVHFYGTASLLSPLATTILVTLLCATRQTSGRKHCLAFLAKMH